MEKPLSLLTFPCDFPIKILAENNFELEAFVKETLSVHIKNKKSIQIRSRKSSLENYVSITATFEAEDKSQLDKLYQVFSTHPKIKMVL